MGASGYGRMKGMHRKRVLKHLKVDLYISSNPIQKKAVSQREKISKKEKRSIKRNWRNKNYS